MSGKGSFRDLYRYCQELKPKVSRKHITPKVLELTGQKIKAIKSGLDISVCRGLFISASNTDHPFVKQNGCNVIVIARDLNYCWERMVFTKELMHLFDSQDAMVNTPEKFEKLSSELVFPGTERSAALSSEIRAFWMALSCLCPEEYRVQFKSEIEKKHTDNYSVALKLRIPEQYVPSLFNPGFKHIVESLLG